MGSSTNILGKILYAICFLLLLPTLLILWANNTNALISYPPIQSSKSGILIIVIGFLMMLWGMFSLNKYGKGLPMNAYPPPVFVKQGPYRLFHHPIYIGFGLLMIGYFIYEGSASGLWLVTPVAILSMVALVWGYESKDLQYRFPAKQLRTYLDFPESTSEKIRFKDRFVTLIWILTGLLLHNFIIAYLFGPNDPLLVVNILSSEIQHASWSIMLGILYILWVIIIIEEKGRLRKLLISSLMAISMSLYLTVLYPELSEQTMSLGAYLSTEQLFFVPVFLIFIGFWRIKDYIKPIVLITGLAGLMIIALQVVYSEITFPGILISFLIFLVAGNYTTVWSVLRQTSERIANSWREWTFGKVRVINHGFYVGFAAFFGIFLAGVLAGHGYAWGLLVFSVTVVVFSALWAQIIEGSEKLKRPFGYYGALVGILFGALAVWGMGLNGWMIIGVVSVLMPWVQGIGRLRCLINGCCHGHKVDDPSIGIRYYHHRSRVCGISNLKGELLHPTPLYAIIWLFLVGFVLLELWLNNYSAPFIFGLYLILTGIGRFVEEAYRGEVQTAIVKGLRLYQWTAILSVLVGVAMTLITIDSLPHNPAYNNEALFAAIIGGVFVFFAMGVDFPESNTRFSRLV